MNVNEKFTAIRKGLLEFLVLRIIEAEKVYVADILKELSATEFATQEGTLYPLLSKMRRERPVTSPTNESETGRNKLGATMKRLKYLIPRTDPYAFTNSQRR